jgi:glycosyltransferase involved in cell wall biosynthesis
MNSRFEGIGMALIEAMACGLPCISFNCPNGPADIIDNEKNGFLIEMEILRS